MHSPQVKAANRVSRGLADQTRRVSQGLTSKKTDRPVNHASTATNAQIFKLLALLRIRPRNTYELRARGISHPAGRVLDLQTLGYVVNTSRVATVDGDGFLHAGVALYTLESEPTQEGGVR